MSSASGRREEEPRFHPAGPIEFNTLVKDNTDAIVHSSGVETSSLVDINILPLRRHRAGELKGIDEINSSW